ncbi:hypothetical protein GQ600_14758 [Phytophthora cactorum]|nr:hypothetical protein GQ600_14758 [Phytophthora cactorum]
MSKMIENVLNSSEATPAAAPRTAYPGSSTFRSPSGSALRRSPRYSPYRTGVSYLSPSQQLSRQPTTTRQVGFSPQTTPSIPFRPPCSPAPSSRRQSSPAKTGRPRDDIWGHYDINGLRSIVRLLDPIIAALRELEADTVFLSGGYRWFRWLRYHAAYGVTSPEQEEQETVLVGSDDAQAELETTQQYQAGIELLSDTVALISASVSTDHELENTAAEGENLQDGDNYEKSTTTPNSPANVVGASLLLLTDVFTAACLGSSAQPPWYCRTTWSH